MTTAAVRIERIAAGGEGVGHLPDGRVVFVPRTAPGDLVEPEALEVRRRFARARAGRVVEPSPDRVEPVCAHYAADDCGGCALQHLSYGAQLRAKGAIVGDALRRIARLDVPDPEVVPNASPFGWRSRLTLAVDRRRGRTGLRRAARPDEVFDLVRCEIAAPALRSLWDALRARRDLLPEDAARLTLREDRDGSLHVVAHGASAWPGAAELVASLAAAGFSPTLWIEPEGAPPRAVGGPRPSRAATVFEQVDAAMGDVVRDAAVAACGDVRGRHAWDLYSGTGAASAGLAAAGASVECVESDPQAVEAAASASTGAAVTRHVARAEDAVAGLGRPDVVLANPPRAGMDSGVLDEIARRRPSRLVYVSCDPATLARDLARLGAAFELVSVRAFDAFPQTAHVETVAALRPRDGASR